MNRILIIFFLCGFSFAQDYGFIKFQATDTWIIEIDDTLITSNDVIKIENGNYIFNARPQISYSWPSLSIQSEVRIETGDTTLFQLSADKGLANNINIKTDLPKSTSYKNLDYHPNPSGYPKLKTGLLITSIAANWLAFYLKREADKNYARYGRASRLSDINKFYNLAGDFDNASTVALTISAAALTGYIYIALTE